MLRRLSHSTQPQFLSMFQTKRQLGFWSRLIRRDNAEVLKALGDLREEFKASQLQMKADMKADMKAEVAEAKDELKAELKASQAHMTTAISNLQSSHGILTERILREQVASMMGTNYAKQYTARCITDVVAMVLSSQWNCDESEDFKLHDLTKKCDIVARELLHKRAHLQLLKSIIKHVVVCTQSQSNGVDAVEYCHQSGLPKLAAFLASDDKTLSEKDDLRELYELSKLTKEEHLRKFLITLKNFFQMDQASKQSHVCGCKGPGLMMLLHYAAPHLICRNDYRDFSFYENLDFDVRGRVQLFFIGKHSDVETESEATVIVDVGEIKSSLDYRTAVLQLGVRIKALQTAAQLSMSPMHIKPRGFGRLFVPRSTKGVKLTIDDQQCNKAMEYGYSLYLHSL